MVTDPNYNEPVKFESYRSGNLVVQPISLSDAFSTIVEALNNIKVAQLKRLSDAKKIAKLKIKVANLEIDIKDIIGG